jgi:hypothetical protein
MTKNNYYTQRISVCLLAYYFCWLAFANNLPVEGCLELALTTSSLWYHTTHSQLARKVDIVTAAITAPSVAIISAYKGNYYPLFFDTLVFIGYFTKSVGGSMRDHFIYVHVPALLSQFSTSVLTQNSG